MPTVSLCMIVKNEERTLARCLDSIKDLVDEMIIVDTGSTDRTKEIAAAYNAKLYDFKWIDDFSAARNFSFSKATCDYIYMADADEVIDEKNRIRFRQLLSVLDEGVEIVQMIYVNPPDKNMAYNDLRELRPKLFKRLRTFRFIDPIHETVALLPVVFDSDIEILHLPEELHSKRDFEAIRKAKKRHGVLSDRLWSMYAKELFISGEKEDFMAAEEDFKERIAMEGLSENSRLEALCVLAKSLSICDNEKEFTDLCHREFFAKNTLPSELWFMIGEQYEKKGQQKEAIKYYKNAAAESECAVCKAYGDLAALEKAIGLAKEYGSEEMLNELEGFRSYFG